MQEKMFQLQIKHFTRSLPHWGWAWWWKWFDWTTLNDSRIFSCVAWWHICFCLRGIPLATMVTTMDSEIFLGIPTSEMPWPSISPLAIEAFLLELELQVPERLPLLGANAFYVQLDSWLWKSLKDEWRRSDRDVWDFMSCFCGLKHVKTYSRF